MTLNECHDKSKTVGGAWIYVRGFRVGHVCNQQSFLFSLSFVVDIDNIVRD
jgi:hypothetical protein